MSPRGRAAGRVGGKCDDASADCWTARRRLMPQVPLGGMGLAGYQLRRAAATQQGDEPPDGLFVGDVRLAVQGTQVRFFDDSDLQLQAQ